jgi:hypothetical protein
MGMVASPAVGVAGALGAARRDCPDIVLADYDLLVSTPLEAWESDELFSQLPVVAVSLTRRPSEVCALDMNGIAGFLYLPTLDRETALRVLGALRPPIRGGYSMRELPRGADITTH